MPAPKPFSIRMHEQTHKRLSVSAERHGESKARLAERLIDEGLRIEDHPGISFRDGPAGRRAALAQGPDIWEVIQTLKRSELADEDAIAAAAEWGNLMPAKVRTALRYYADHPDEIDRMIALNEREAERQRANWERARRAIE